MTNYDFQQLKSSLITVSHCHAFSHWI